MIVLKIILGTVIALVVFFVVSFTVYFFNIDMKITSLIYPHLIKHYEKRKREHKL